MIAAAVYQMAARALFAPFGGIGALRRRAVDSLELRPGAKILELGCGPGDMTAELLRRGAVVHAVDSSAAMLRVATERAPHAVFTHTDIRSYQPSTEFDATLAAFVLHEIAPSEIPRVVRMAAASLAPRGRLVILDHAIPGGVDGALWRAVLYLVESSSIDAWLALDLHRVLRNSGLVVLGDQPLAGGRARMMIARQAGTSE
ncbi:MAG: class I SAM-dependent methyltransferase [Anaerolineae bacterium]|nr:class I SAM-dependent methyltransferase [Gemmatimonadaceae bacterium]